MDKNAIKKYAVWARQELIERVSQRAMLYGITETNTGDPHADSVNGRLLSPVEKRQRAALIVKIQRESRDGQESREGYERVMEEVAYTWFNRFAALRFMEVNGYLPSHVRVFTNEAGEFKPQILAEAIHLELDGLDREKVYTLEQANQTEELFKYLLIVQCNALNGILPGMFQRIEDYTELLLPDYLLREGSVIERMVRQNTPDSIPEEDWTDQVQIIGWLYQYYISEKKDRVFADLKKNIKISKDNIPAATQLFTPDWIVHYMVENSLGRLWLEGHPDSTRKAEWKYYLDEAEQEPEVQAQLAELREEYAALKPEDIRVIDPCMGSGHILCVLFDVLIQIYEDYGYTAREAAAMIVENNLYGLDIDDRAAQLAYFSVMMKARKYDRRFFSRKVQPHIYAIPESDWIEERLPLEMGDFLLSKEHQETLRYLAAAFRDGKECGSLLKLEPRDYAGFSRAWELTATQTAENLGLIFLYEAAKDIVPGMAGAASALTQKYDVVVTNPPYMGVSNASTNVQNYVKKAYPDSKADLFAVFIERCRMLTKGNGFQAMITQQAWMFLSSFEKLRLKLQTVDTVNMAHLGARAFEEIGGEVVQTTSFVLRQSHINGYAGTYCRLIEPTTQQGKEDMFLAGENQYVAKQSNFSKIPGSPVVYWIGASTTNCFERLPFLKDFGRVTLGMRTGDNERFLRLWHEVRISKTCFTAPTALCAKKTKAKWFPYNKGGEFRKWFGNLEYVVNWENDGFEIKENTRAAYPQLGDNLGWKITSEDKYFCVGLAWSRISSSNFGVRQCRNLIFDTAAPMFFPNNDQIDFFSGLLCSVVAIHFLNLLNPTLTFQVGDVAKLPIIQVSALEQKTKITEIVKQNVFLAQEDWDSFETSWDFKTHPLVRWSRGLWDATAIAATMAAYYGGRPKVSGPLELCYLLWQGECNERFQTLKANEEELNRIFIDIYGLQDELTPEVEDKDVTVRKADLGRDIRSLVSYAVGCMFGRYSLDAEGLILAGQDFGSRFATDPQGYLYGESATLTGNYIRMGDDSADMRECSFFPDKDNIIPICDDDYFEDDITGRFVKWVEVVYGKDTLEANLKFIADALGGKGTPREVIRNYFLGDFYADHLKTYQKRPIYWLFDSGKKNGFKCLIYMHRYQPDTIARIRTDYVHEQQSRYRTALAELEQRQSNASASERVKLSKQRQKIQEQAEELRIYEEKVHHLADQMISIDLDDGVKRNYEIFKDVLAKIK